jgi:DNA polymerase I-like protein with 3'-5' exonuclease and polymerase domains
LILGWDVETSTIERGHVHHPDNFLVSYSVAEFDSATSFHYYKDPDFLDFLVDRLRTCTELVGFNLKFDIQWLMRNGISIPKGIRIYDVALAEQILTAQQAQMVSFNEVLESYGIPQKLDVVKGYWEQGVSTEHIPVKIVEEYNNDDAEKPLLVRDIQRMLLSEQQQRLLYQQGADLMVLARCELNGVKFNRERAEDDHKKYSQQLQETEDLLHRYLPVDFPHRDVSFNWDSGDQLSALLYGGTIAYDYSIPENRVYGPKAQNPGEAYIYNRWHQHVVEFPRRFDPLPRSEVKKTKDDVNCINRFYSVDDPTLRQLRTRSADNRRLLDALARKAKLSKVVETFDGLFKRLDRFQWGDYLHGQYNQNVARTGRLSSSNPNSQNFGEEVEACLESRYND